MKTIVYQLGTRNEYIYTVPPCIAVVNAYSAKIVYCGDFAVKAE